MRVRSLIASGAVVAAMVGAAQAGIEPDWWVVEDFNSSVQVTYTGPMVISSINSDFDITNLIGLPIIGVSFTILPTAGELYDPGEFESIVFDTTVDTGDDVAPYVPPSLLNPTPFTVTPSNDNGFGPQTLTFDFPTAPLAPGETLEARFQIEWPTDALFDVLISPIVIPTPAALGVFAAAGFFGGSRRRRG